MGGGSSGSTSRPTEFAQDYLARFVGMSPRSRENQDRSAQSLKLEERAKSKMANDCCNFPIAGFADLTDRSIVEASSGNTIKADLATLLDVNNDDKIDCSEVHRALCMVNPVTETRDEVWTREGAGYLDVQHRRVDAEVDVHGVPAPLEVPAQFAETRYDWAAPSTSQPAPTPELQEKLQSCMKPFIQAMLIGVLVRLRLEPGEAPPNGQSIDATINLNEELDVLLISVGGAQQPLCVKDIRLVRPPEKGTESDKCVDLRLAGGRFVRFHFDTQAQVKFFGTCMRLLVKASRSNMATTPATLPRAA